MTAKEALRITGKAGGRNPVQRLLDACHAKVAEAASQGWTNVAFCPRDLGVASTPTGREAVMIELRVEGYKVETFSKEGKVLWHVYWSS